ncbi:MAG: hypothetical protein ACT4N4_05115 [Rhodospirillales bacterium]
MAAQARETARADAFERMGIVMIRRLPAALFAIALILAGPAPGWAQAYCAPRQAMVRFLDRTFGEIPVMHGISDIGALMEILASPDGSWTILMTRPGGLSCVVATGQNWQSLQPRRDEPAA